MHIIHIASELAPLAKVGGLADVLLGLSRELSWKGHDVDIIIPRYDCIDSNEIRDLSIVQNDLMTPYDGGWFSNTVWMGWVENLRVYFIDPHHPRYFFNRGCFYGCDDDIERYLYFSRIAMEFILKQPFRADVIHIHDWQTAIIPVLYKEMYKELGFPDTKFVFTIHNFDYQGKCSSSDLDKIGLKGSEFLTSSKLQDPTNPALINLLKGGIVYSDFFTTVSPTYSKEVKGAEGRGLEKVVIQNQNKFAGILNGVDYSFWNPEIDRYLPVHFSPREMPANKKDRNTIDKKGFVKKLLRERLCISEEHKPIVGSITRLVPQKGVELIKAAIHHTLANGGQFVLLGSTSIPEISDEFHALKHQLADNPNVHLLLHHQEDIAHLIFAASDMFIVPSLFEPCGLTQLIALKYGSIPIVRHTGGLADTIFDVDNSGKPFDETNGFVFNNPDKQSIELTLDRAFNYWFHQPDKWRKLMINSMYMDYSWNKSSNKYLDIYQSLIKGALP
ncbi:MAG: glycogen synthase [Parachlamydiaceae bacterium]|nr:glycogen synthase [Parachlamydiaceae bacterium]